VQGSACHVRFFQPLGDGPHTLVELKLELKLTRNSSPLQIGTPLPYLISLDIPSSLLIAAPFVPLGIGLTAARPQILRGSPARDNLLLMVSNRQQSQVVSAFEGEV
jgi:hypothetical protein